MSSFIYLGDFSSILPYDKILKFAEGYFNKSKKKYMVGPGRGQKMGKFGDVSYGGHLRCPGMT